MSKEQRAAARESLYAQIDSLREANREERTRLINDFKRNKAALNAATKQDIAAYQDDFRATKSDYRTNHKQVKAQYKDLYDQKYEEALNELRSKSEYQRTTKSKK